MAVNVPNSEFLWILGGATPTCVNGIIQSLVNDNVNDKYELTFIDFLTWWCFKGIYCLGNCYVIVELHSEWERIMRWTTSIMFYVLYKMYVCFMVRLLKLGRPSQRWPIARQENIKQYILKKLVVNHNHHRMKSTLTWIKINPLQPTDVTFSTCWRKPMFPERSITVKSKS